MEDFHKTYETQRAVQGLSFELRAGDILGLVGRNGAGKTTTLRVVSGILPPTHGRFQVGEHDLIADPVSAKRLLAYVPDEPRLFESLTVEEHLEFIASAYEVAHHRATAEALLDRFELTAQRDTLCQALSRGMRQKTAICCALLRSPRVILFDEPLTGLDPAAIRTIKEVIVERARSGAGIVLSSHLLALVEGLCNRYLILERGQCRFFGDPAQACATFPGANAQVSLEEVFFRATSDKNPRPSP